MKKKIAILILFTSVFSSVFSQKNTFDFNLGISKDSLIHCKWQKDIKIISGSSTMIEGAIYIIDSIEFLIGFDKNNRVVFYSTFDTTFLVNNFQYFTQKKQIIDSLKAIGITYDEQGAFLKLPADWNLGFDKKSIEVKNGQLTLKNDALPNVLFKKSPYINSSVKWKRKDKKSGNTFIEN